jgi:Peptidase family M48
VHVSVYVPFVVSAVVAVLAPRLALRLPPGRAAWALALTAVVTAGAWLGALTLLAFTALAQIPEVAEQGPWSVPVLRAKDPVWLGVGVGGAVALLATAAVVGVVAVRRTRALALARRTCARLPGAGELAVLDDPSPHAFALPGRPGRIVVSRAMLRCLDGTEREALLAHERAHLRHRHHRFEAVWQLTAAANPLLRPVAATGAFLLERWADEEAAASVGDRAVVARAVARAALASARGHRVPAALAADGGAVPRRVRALLDPPPRHRPLPLLVGGLLLAVCCVSLVDATTDDEAMVESAMHAACASHAVHRVPPSVDGAATGVSGHVTHGGRWRGARSCHGGGPAASYYKA